jgi:hypothetical protein
MLITALEFIQLHRKCTNMSKKVDESYNFDKEAREDEDIRKCLP